MINEIITKFQTFRKRLFGLFRYRAASTMDLIDAVSAETNATSIVKFSLSDLFRRKYSSITDVLDSLFRSDLKKSPTREDTKKQTLKITQLLAEECPPPQKQGFALFAIDCTANPRIYAEKVCDRTVVHAPNHVPGQKPITVGHEYSILVHLPDRPIDRELRWVIPLSVRRVESNESGPQIGFAQLKEISHETIFKDQFCVNVSDAAYSTRRWVIEVSKCPNVVHIARMRGNKKVYQMPLAGSKKRRGRPLVYGEEILLSDPSQPDLEEISTVTTRKGRVLQVHLARWNDVIMQGSDEERTHEHPFDMLRVIVKDNKGKPVYRRPLWVMITGARRREVTSLQAYTSYGRRYDIEHFFRYGKQKLSLVKSQTCETRHEESWHWIGILTYNMLYHAKELSQTIAHPWEKRKVHVVAPMQRPSQVQRDYGRIIRGIGTPAGVPKPRGKSPGRQAGVKAGQRPPQPLIRKSKKSEESESESSTRSLPLKKRGGASAKNITNGVDKAVQGLKKAEKRKKTIRHKRMRRVWAKNRPAPMRC
jgi:hypothetical protein